MSSRPNLLLKQVDMTLNVCYMFLESRGVDSNVSWGKGVIKGGEFAIHKHFSGVKTAGKVYLLNVLDSSAYFFHSTGVDMLARDTFEVIRDHCK